MGVRVAQMGQKLFQLCKNRFERLSLAFAHDTSLNLIACSVGEFVVPMRLAIAFIPHRNRSETQTDLAKSVLGPFIWCQCDANGRR
jgi:hypothetical protein